MLCDLRLPPKLEKDGKLRGAGVEDAQLDVVGVEAEHRVRIAALDADPQGLEVQLARILAASPAAPGRLCLGAIRLERGDRGDILYHPRRGVTTKPSWVLSLPALEEDPHEEPVFDRL